MRATDTMPTAGRLFAAIGLAILAWVLSQKVRPLLPPDTNYGYFDYVNIALGLWAGWVVIGKRLSRGIVPGINAGITGLGVLLFWGIFIQAANEMLERSLDRRYEGPFEAIIGLFELSVEYALILIDGSFISVALGGAMFVGFLAELVTKRLS